VKDRGTFASLGALASAVAATSCCIPVLPFAAAAGAAGASAFLLRLQPYLLASAVLLIAYGFYQVRRAKQCGQRPGLARTLVLWTSIAILFAGGPLYLYGGGRVPTGQRDMVRLDSANFPAFRQEFNAASGETRVVVMLSPT
jgi:hypothetical protein